MPGVVRLCALTAGELASEAGVSPRTASSHLARLAHGGLVVRRRQGRHVYYALAGEEVLMESLAGLVDRNGCLRARLLPARAGDAPGAGLLRPSGRRAGVAMLDSLVARGLVEDRAGALSLSGEGGEFMRAFGIEPDGLVRGRRPLCKACLDWSVRRSHMGGALGQALLDTIYARGWARRLDGNRVVAFSAPGLASFRGAFPHTPVGA